MTNKTNDYKWTEETEVLQGANRFFVPAWNTVTREHERVPFQNREDALAFANALFTAHHAISDEPATPAPEPAPAVTPVENHVEVVLPADMLWVDVDDANYDRDATESGFIRKLTTTLQDYGFTVNASFGAVVSAQLTHANGDPVGGWDYDTMHALIDATKCDYVAAAPAPVNNAPVYHTVLLPDTFVDFQAREDIEIVHQSKDPDGLIRLAYRVKATAQPAPVKSHIDASMGYTERYKPENWRSETPTNPGYDSLKALADKQDEYIQALEARVKELEGDMKRLAASELELVQQNTLLNSLVDRLCERGATVETAAQNAVEAYGKQDAEYTMRVLAHLVGIEWN